MKPGSFHQSLALAVLCTASLCSHAATSAFSAVYVFGDSLSDSGNIAALIGSNPGQVITGNSYIPSQPYASGQFSNGDVWAKSFASSLGLSANASLTGGTDYAFGGARAATDGTGLPPSAKTQVTLFSTAVGNSAPSSALYVVAAGGNDARDLLQSAATSATPSAVIAAGAAAYAAAMGNIIDSLQALGAQRIVVWDVPNLAAAPAVTALGAGATFLGGQVSLAMNAALTTRMAGEGGVSIFDDFGLVNTIVANPAAYGLTNVTDACGAVVGCDPSKYLFWDGIHPTSAGHALLAAGMLAAVPEPSTLLMLAAGMAVLLVTRKRSA